MVMAIDAHHVYRESLDPVDLKTAVDSAHKALGYWKEPKAAEEVQSWIKAGKSIRSMGVAAQFFGEQEIKGGRKCWNSDETGPGDGAQGWATLRVPTPDPSRPVTLEIDVWGTSSLSAIVVRTASGAWQPARPESRLSRKEQWDTLVYRIPARLLDPDRKVQRIGFGGSDSQVWIAEVRVKP
jgi:hypothetical protein